MSNQVKTSQITLNSLLQDADDEFFLEKIQGDVGYEFSNGRDFLNTDSSDSGVYG